MRDIGRILALPALPPNMLADDLVPVEDGHRSGGDPDPQQLPGVGVGHGVMLGIAADVVVPSDLELLPFHRVEPVGRQRLEQAGLIGG